MQTRIGLFRALGVVVLCTVLQPAPSAQLLGLPISLRKLDPILQTRVSLLTGRTRIIVRATRPDTLGTVGSLISQLGGTPGKSLSSINGYAASLPNSSLLLLAGSSLVQHISADRLSAGAMERTGPTTGASAVRADLGLDGSGVGVAIIDSGITSWHDDVSADGRVDRFVDFVNGQPAPYDDYGHGTHVAGIIGGNGFDSGGARSGIAPGAHLVALKALDGSGRGRISDIIAALDYVVANRAVLNIRVVNLSIATGVYESYDDDPLTQAALEAVRAGIVVVAAAGNNGRSPDGRTQYGGVAAPGNAPWVLTVGASSHMGTVDRSDDTIAGFSSRGPSAVNYNAKPDLVAPGVGIESLSDPDSAFYTAKPDALLAGTVDPGYLPYMSLSGTSMAAPVVAGTVALMLQANPSLTPNAVKAILQYTAQEYDGLDALTQGAGFLNAKGAVELARAFADSTATYSTDNWSGRLLWGTRLVRGGMLTADANAWALDVTWGTNATPQGAAIEWGEFTDAAHRWGTGDPFVNAVWGGLCGGADCSGPWNAQAASQDGDTVVWGSSDGGDTVVWGSSDGGDTVVWGSSCQDPSCGTVIWSRM